MDKREANSFERQRFALNWAKENLPEEKYNEINKAYKKLLKTALIFVSLCAVSIIVTFSSILFIPSSKRIDYSILPEGATEYVFAHVDYDDNFWWTNDSIKYEHPICEYGMSPQDYEFGDTLVVYLDEAQNVIKVIEYTETPVLQTSEILVRITLGVVLPLAALVVYFSNAKRTYGKPWYEFYEGFDVF